MAIRSVPVAVGQTVPVPVPVPVTVTATGVGQRFAAVDVYYLPTGGARAALVVAADRRFATLVCEQVTWLDHVAAYQPSRFVAHELPPIAAVLAHAGPLDLLVIDGYVDLDPAGRPGLGAHLHTQIGVPVVGVAKTVFRGAEHAVAVRRGTAVRPLYVTADGIAREQAGRLVADMAGRNRIPDVLRRVDRLARGDPHQQ